ncbi:hypothetical protein QR680_012789 [Steinernema hermaphroditum]|uniref:Uncharacterized protein n=1 Tax=Steinernema hermaphroditum TaxID=289476 RepID=A0AA39I4V4_9BILA|nr:hypothetical protein QR680_012789 [Steinernema hermaphroditum]
MFSRKKEKDKEKSNEGVQNDSKASYTSMQVNIFYVFLLNELIFLSFFNEEERHNAPFTVQWKNAFSQLETVVKKKTESEACQSIATSRNFTCASWV